MKLEKMVEELNEYVNGSLIIMCNNKGWQIKSLELGSFFDINNFRKSVKSSTFIGVIEKAYKIMQEDKKTKEV